ncbi:macrolide family glycosyltransferase [Actinocorallia sp. A-T 12471]|uniref:macrolide family glycosyltransferase n=1 Tax=Actinocorallia sp. A-T 12471 TaxID=3089813 RepID=UPI0029D20729|nr:macrolide family glycosyltransferase [Actinocorallia sp. A-T 12471]MDX6738320.1 macrolide family glycosyltransferase [Actinocorallia sp. A-T 12471]
MHNAHIAMVGIPAISHVLPSLEIIRELVARGHRVTYANDPAQPAVADAIRGTGAELVPYRSTLPVADNDWPDDPIAASELFLDDAVSVLSQIAPYYDAQPADLYLQDIAGYAARVLAESQGRPLVQLSPAYVAWKGYEEEVGAYLKGLPGASEYHAKFAAWLASTPATTKDPDAFSGRPPRCVATVPRAMQPHADRVDESVVTFVGPCFGTRAEQGTWTRPDGVDNVLLISLGSAYTRQPDFYRRCVSAYGDLPGWHVVLQIGEYVDIAELGPLPANVEAHAWVPQLAILTQADAFVTHAGMGGCAEGLYTATPMIAVPQAVDQPANADRLVELGVARRLDSATATPADLREALRELTADPDVRARCADLAKRARAEGGEKRAADVVESLL